MKRALSPIIPGGSDDDDDSNTGHMIKHVRMEDGIEAFTEVIDSETVTTEEVDTEGMTIVEEEDMVPVQDPPSFQNLIIQNMNIDEPLTTLKKLLELRLQCSLSGHEFYLQDCLPLEPSKSLVEQCVQGTGMVQINVEVKSQPGVSPKINIVDILKPADELEEEEEEETAAIDVSPVPAVVQKLVQAASSSSMSPAASSSKTITPNTKMVIPFSEESDNVTRWIVDSNFRKEQDRLKIPYDPLHWNESHVRHWIMWAIKQFDLKDVTASSLHLTGAQLCGLSHPAFSKYVPNDPGDLFWTHLELLRKCKFVAVVQQPTPHAITTITVSTSGKKMNRQKGPRTPRIGSYTSNRTDEKIFGSPGNRTGNNGQIQLWQFLLELLTDKDCREIIQWVGDFGEFKLTNPEMVAQMWGQRKNKQSMNYEKLSRALRYYYDGDMISKSHGKRFVYKFVCDLKMLLGYSAAELSVLVTDCAERKLQRMRDSIQKGLVKMGMDHTEGAYTIVETT